MIISGGSRSNGKWFSTHLLKDENERVSVVEIRGLGAQDVREAFREMEFIAEGTNCKNYFYHANLNPKAHERLTEEQWEQAEDMLERHLRLDGHARFVVEHEKGGRIHRHVVWCRIDPDTMTATSDSFTARDHEKAAREIEQAFGLEPVESVLVKDRATERPERRAAHWEKFRSHATGLDPEAMRDEITALWQGADSGQAFRAALENSGYLLAKGDRRDFVIVDAAGHEHSLAKRISGERAATIRARLGDIDRDELPTVADAREWVRAAADSESSAAVSTEPGGQRDLGEPELPGKGPQTEPEQPGGQRPGSAASGDLVRARAADGAPERESPWGNAWRAFADRAAHFAEQMQALWQDESSGGAPTPPQQPDASAADSAAGKTWVERVMESKPVQAGRHVLHSWQHRDGIEAAEGIAEAAALARDAIRPHAPAARESAFEKATRTTVADGERSSGAAPARGAGARRMSAFDRLAAEQEAAKTGEQRQAPATRPGPEPRPDNVPDFD
jgi:hypothetical protein